MTLQRAETVIFNPAILEHRMAVKAYLKRNAWVDTNIRFRLDPKFGSLIEQIRSKMLNWYIEQESLAVD